jgi:hypothetical protein
MQGGDERSELIFLNVLQLDYRELSEFTKDS